MKLSFASAAERLAESEVAHRRCMKNCLPSLVGQRPQAQRKIVCCRKRFHPSRFPLASPGGLLANEQRYLVATSGQMLR
jgi:hypothetical protein